jgi:NADH:ubiquinone oxidoreductase subunit F (NADH-binding)
MTAKPHVESFYHLAHEPIAHKCCQGTACLVARHLNPDRWREANEQTARVYCLGKCYMSPSSSDEDVRPRIESHAKTTVLLNRVVKGEVRTLKQYGKYAALERVLGESPEKLIQAVETSGLRGRGGAGFPTGRKWRVVFQQPPGQKYVVANADEGDAGAYIDRFLMEDDPHCFIESMIIAGYAVGASKGYIYLRKEYPVANEILQKALAEAIKAGYIGEKIRGSNFSYDLEIYEGHGAYICGEETALLNSLEGKRPEVRARPPYPTECGLWGKPTLVNNVETLMNVPWIILNGADTYRALGFNKSQGTKLVSLNSLFQRPGLYEVDFGITVRDIVEKIGGGLKSGTLKGVIIGGPLAGIVPPSLLDTKFGFEELRSIGAMIGHGGIVAFDERTSIKELIHHVFDFGAFESCGKCTPCREGGRRIEQIFGTVMKKGHASKADRKEWDEIDAALLATSLCGLGTGLGEFAVSAIKHYSDELKECFV